MKIYVVHASSFDFVNELYAPLKASSLAKTFEFVFPHEKNVVPKSSKKLLQKGNMVVLAEVSYPSTGMGVELGWANAYNNKIICCYKQGARAPNSVRLFADDIIEYTSFDDLIAQVKTSLEKCVPQTKKKKRVLTKR